MGRSDSCLKKNQLFPRQPPNCLSVCVHARKFMQRGRFSTWTVYDSERVTLLCQQLLRQTFISPINDWTSSTSRTYWRPNLRDSCKGHRGNVNVKFLRWLDINSVNKGPVFLSNFWCYRLVFYFSLPQSKKDIYWGDHCCWTPTINLRDSTRFVPDQQWFATTLSVALL